MTESLARLAEEAAKALTALAEGARTAGDTSAASTPRPVTSEETGRALKQFLRTTPANTSWLDDIRAAVDEHIAEIARDHGLLTPEEVERRAREWVATYTQGCFPTNSLLETLLRREVPRG